MQTVIITNPQLKEELLANGVEADANIVWIEDVNEMQSLKGAEIVIDMVFEVSHLALLQSLSNSLVVINSVELTLAETDPSFVRINGWPGFLQSQIIEAACLTEGPRKKVEEVFSLFHKTIEWLTDMIGFVTPRVISMIINEAYIALNEDVSTKEEINTAMKLGTNYPYGPFEWAEKIGIERIHSLLSKLAAEKEHYTPAVM